MKKQVKYWVLLIVVLLIGISEGRTQTVVVKSVVDGLPIPNVLIYNVKRTASVMTNRKGEARLDAFSEEELLFMRHPSYENDSMLKSVLVSREFVHYMVNAAISLPEFTFTSARDRYADNRSPLKSKEILGEETALFGNATTADMLQVNGGVSVQRSQMGGGSPVIRGFEANKVLLVVDGVRLNNAIYRSGHLQNAITVDNNSLERTEILFGPGSVVYGSDALGGVIHFHTRVPETGNAKNIAKANTFLRYGTAANQNTAHVDFELGSEKWGSYTAVTGSSFGALRMGSSRSHGYAGFGEVPRYVVNPHLDTVSQINPDINFQQNTGYQQVDILEKLVFAPRGDQKFIANIQYSNSSDVPRFDQLNNFKGDSLEYAEWRYGPQKRLMTALEYQNTKSKKMYDFFSLIAAYQELGEDRHSRRLKSTTRTSRFEDVAVYSLNADFNKRIDSSVVVFYGLEGTHQTVTSSAFTEDIFTSVTGPAVARYPDGGSNAQSYALYGTLRKQFSPRATLNLGSRYSYARFHSEYLPSTLYKIPFTEFQFGSRSLTGSASINYSPQQTWDLYLTVSSGFRNPNVDDYGKTREKDGFVQVPNKDLGPEYAYCAEIGLSKKVDKDVVVNSNVYYTLLRGAIVQTNYQINGQDSILYDGAMARVLTNTNAGNAIIYGFSASVDAAITNSLKFHTNFNFTQGENLTNNQPMPHIPPFFGKSQLSVQTGKWNSSFYIIYNGWKQIADYAPSSEDNPIEATPDGTPAWHTLNVQTAYSMESGFGFQIGIENLFDQHYKPFASGVSAPGRNFVFTLRYRV